MHANGTFNEQNNDVAFAKSNPQTPWLANPYSPAGAQQRYAMDMLSTAAAQAATAKLISSTAAQDNPDSAVLTAIPGTAEEVEADTSALKMTHVKPKLPAAPAISTPTPGTAEEGEAGTAVVKKKRDYRNVPAPRTELQLLNMKNAVKRGSGLMTSIYRGVRRWVSTVPGADSTGKVQGRSSPNVLELGFRFEKLVKLLHHLFARSDSCRGCAKGKKKYKHGDW